jgi:hypothetical protein
LVIATKECEVIKYDYKADSTIVSLPFAAEKALPFSDGLLLLVTIEGHVSIYDIKANKIRSTGLQVSCLAVSSS